MDKNGKYYNIHNLVRIYVETSNPVKMQQVMNHFAEFQVEADPEQMPDIIIKDYYNIPDHENKYVIDNSYYYSDGKLNMPDYRLYFDLISQPIEVYCDRIILPLNFLVHLALLLKGQSLLHCGAVEFEGKNYLFPAMGGTGKTTLISSLVFEGGKLYGDDMAIINENEVLSYPLDFTVYPYHLPILRLEDHDIERHFKRTALLNQFTNILERNNSRPFKLARVVLNTFKVPHVNVPPRRIFGSHCFGDSGQVHQIYYLLRTMNKSKHLSIVPFDPLVLAEVCTNILLHEWHESMHYLYIYSALSTFSLEKVHNSTRNLMAALFQTRPCFQVEIPAVMTNNEYQAEFIRYLRLQGQ